MTLMISEMKSSRLSSGNGHTADGAASATEAVARVEGGDDDLVLKEE